MWQDLVKISNQESVEAVKSIPGANRTEQSSERKGEPIGVIELPKISCRESAEVVKIIPQERILW